MSEITISTIVTEDRRLVLDLPPDIPTGPVSVTITPVEAQIQAEMTPREIARAKLLAAGFLVTDFGISDDIERLSDEEILELGTMPEGTRPSEELIDEDRGPH